MASYGGTEAAVGKEALEVCRAFAGGILTPYKEYDSSSNSVSLKHRNDKLINNIFFTN